MAESAQDIAPAPAPKWYHWYSPDDSSEERKLILKLDLLIVPYAFILYWVKYIDQTNISPSQAFHITVQNRQDRLLLTMGLLGRQCLRIGHVRRPRVPRQ